MTPSLSPTGAAATTASAEEACAEPSSQACERRPPLTLGRSRRSGSANLPTGAPASPSEARQSVSHAADGTRSAKAKQAATAAAAMTRKGRRLQARARWRRERVVDAGVHVERGKERGVGETGRGRSLCEEDV